jgi:uncharacterized GH25 family protein
MGSGRRRLFWQRARLCAAAVLLAAPGPGRAHEYWIAVEPAQVGTGDRVDVHLLVGQMLKGTELPWLTHQTESFQVVTPDGTYDVVGREGDLPAIAYLADNPGLNVIAQVTTPLTLTFDSLEQFRDYLDFEGLDTVEAEHRRRGLPDADFTEAYVRAAKALVQVGPVRGEDSDKAIGLPFELVALGNPYAGGSSLRVRLLWRGQPEAGTQIAIFRQAAVVERTRLVTDSQGEAEIPLTGGFLHVLNAVHMEPGEGEAHVWASTWASLSFVVPGAR